MKTGVCIIGRNDGYGGHLEERAIYSINSALKAFDEVVYVDWNSPTEETLLEKVKTYIPEFDRVQRYRVRKENVKFLTHQQDIQKCCEVLARNIGIRRMVEQKIDFIVSSNIDIIFPKKEQLNSFIREYMTDNLFCSVSRRDVNIKFGSQDWQQNANAILEKFDKIHEKLNLEFLNFQYKNYDPFHGHSCMITSCGDFQIAHSKVWNKIRGFEEDFQKRGFNDTNVQLKAYHSGSPLFAYFHLPVFHINHDGGGHSGNGDLSFSKEEACYNRKTTQNSEKWGFINSDFIERF